MNLDFLKLQACLIVQLLWEVVSSSDCAEKGFTDGLLCSACDELGTFGLSDIVTDCKGCCQADSANSVQVYPRAILEVSFIKSPAVNNWPGLEIKYARGADPAIKLIDEADEVKETLNIEAWNTDTILEFLDERLAK